MLCNNTRKMLFNMSVVPVDVNKNEFIKKLNTYKK